MKGDCGKNERVHHHNQANRRTQQGELRYANSYVMAVCLRDIRRVWVPAVDEVTTFGDYIAECRAVQGLRPIHDRRIRQRMVRVRGVRSAT